MHSRAFGIVATTLVMGGVIIAGCGGSKGTHDGGVDAATEGCGNGVVDGLEECDQGSLNSDFTPDACRTDCTEPICGDGVVDSGEGCDEGSRNDDLVPDVCREDCTPPRCGDNIVDLVNGELCDDGNLLDGDGCSPVCLLEFCGSGAIDPGEVCDDGNTTAGDGCSPDCLSDESCGNGRPDFDAGETCDCGLDQANLPPGCDAINGAPEGGCDVSCQSLFCGNGVIDAAEVCDDGNTTAGDGCSPDCLSDESCGNGRTDFAVGESCDCGVDPANLPLGCNGPNDHPDSHCGGGCVSLYCGNGHLDPGEVCDDGNNRSGDGCSADCASDESCGNGYVDTVLGELCDDGNTSNVDACANDCSLPSCGDGIWDQADGELCDDGNKTNGDGCSARCSSDESCGNNIIDKAVGEQCDDGNQVSGDGCTSQCVLPFCGNGNVEGLEVCDDGNQISGDGCSSDCLSDETCGNGYVDVAIGEGCDDGNLLPGDGCRASCTVEQGWTCSYQPSQCTGICGDGLAVGNEPCDGGDLRGQDCTTVPGGYAGGVLTCRPDCGFDASGCSNGLCGDGVVDTVLGEVCDDSNTTDGDGCSADCRSDETCGNGVPDAITGEECDDGNLTGGDGCDATCLNEVCGNSILDVGEACDDGNTSSGDGCSADCLSDETCGNGVVDTVLGEVCDDGNTTGGDGCSADCLSDESCGNNILDALEACDDGNHQSHDGCSSGCTLESMTWVQASPSGPPPGRHNHAMAYDSVRRRMVVFGGFDGSFRLGDTWEYDGTAWVETTPASSPAARSHHAMAYDSNRERVVMHGGYSTTSLSDTWEYDGTTWVNTTPAGAPMREGHTMAYDPGTGRVVLFGGRHPAGAVYGDTWEYDGATWSGSTPVPSPSKRAHSAMEYDATIGRVVLFGGSDTSILQIFRDTWEYDGTNWVNTIVSSLPLQRSGHAVAYSSVVGHTVLIGGSAGASGLPGTYEYNGTAWVSTIPTGAPGGRTGARMVSDTERGRVILFGGASNQYHSDTWEYFMQSAWPDEICNNFVDDDSDGVVDCADPDCAWSGSCQATETSCGDGVDNDGDGVHDCQDGDCFGDGSCVGFTCDASTLLGCGDVEAGTNTGGPSDIVNYGCGGVPETGPEASYAFVAPTSTQVTVTVSGLTADLDVYVISAFANGGCEWSTGCITHSSTGGTNDEQLTFNANAGELYYIVVDGFSGATSNFNLGVTCP